MTTKKKDTTAKKAAAPKKAATKKTAQKKTAAAPKKAAPKKAAPKKAAAKKTAQKKTAPKKTTAAKKASAPKKVSKVSFNREMTGTLQALKKKILAEVSAHIRSESDSEKREIGDIYDIASSERDRELALTLNDRERSKLSEIEDAFDRLSNGTCGTCEECEEPISEDRLRALPFTRSCIECKSKNEKEQKLRGRFEEEDNAAMIDKSLAEDDRF